VDWKRDAPRTYLDRRKAAPLQEAADDLLYQLLAG
jgi:hypothetical protein